MATNKSEFALHVHDKEGNPLVIQPGDDIPSHVKVTNPYVLGKEVDESTAAADDTHSGDDGDDDAAPAKPRRGRARS
ncbi:hypothetical protein [Mycobacterium intracellulare]|uniref:hypothetical protein n=1 Tax=Mycobacterium intracellulare TaxID=1767 RepID=UPI00109E5B07|nr:hypothetical protein [Mycobacterium intracellulare]